MFAHHKSLLILTNVRACILLYDDRLGWAGAEMRCLIAVRGYYMHILICIPLSVQRLQTVHYNVTAANAFKVHRMIQRRRRWLLPMRNSINVRFARTKSTCSSKFR